MVTLRLILLGAHIAFGTAAVVVGLIALLAAKPVDSGRGRVHQRSGRLFLICMVAVLGSALVLTIIAFDPYFAGLTASATIALFSGYRVLGRKRPDLSASHRARAVDWIVTATAFVIGAMLMGIVMTGAMTQNVPVVYALGGGTMTYALYDLYRFARPRAFPFSPDLWLYEHLVKMIGAYFAAVAAFSGSVLVLLPPPWRQLWAVMLGQFLAVALVIFYARRLRARRRAGRPGDSRAMSSPATPSEA